MCAHHDIDVNEFQDNRLATPLLWATVTNRPEQLAELLTRGAKPLLCDVTGKTALQYALEKTYAECAKILKAYSSVARCGSIGDLV